jgi:hypothetical protein
MIFCDTSFAAKLYALDAESFTPLTAIKPKLLKCSDCA